MSARWWTPSRVTPAVSSFTAHAAGSGLLLWTRGEELRLEEPPLCEECALKITIGALIKWESEEEEEG